MQLTNLLRVGLALVVLTGPVCAQSLSPMRKSGFTPTDTKGFRLDIGNPFRKPMTFVIVPMDTKFNTIAEQAMVTPSEARLPPGGTRSVVVQFRIPPAYKERSIGVCVYPKDLEGQVLTRVCGTYTGQLLPRRGG